MFKSLLGLDASQETAGIDIALRGGWVLALVLIAAGLGFVIWQYRSETRLSRVRRTLLGTCQAMALLMVLIIVLEPFAEVTLVQPFRRTMLVLLDTSSSMGIEDERSTPDEIGEAARVLGKLGPAESLTTDRVERLRRELGPVSRFELARKALGDPEVDFIGQLEQNYDVRFFSFDEKVEPEGGAEDPAAWLESRQPDGTTSRVGSAMKETVARHAGLPIAGMVVISDFAWVDGKDPAEVARAFARQGIPVHTVPVGLPAPPDIHLRKVIAPEVVFKGDRVPLRVQIESRKFDGRSVELTLEVDGQRTTSQQIVLRGGLQFAELMFIPERDSGSIQLALSIDELAGETSGENNTVSHRLRVLDEKIKVLYIEGLPRWEFRYLRWVLLRDPRLDVHFLMTQGDPTLAATSPRHLARFPVDADDALKFDLIILGDVPASYFSNKQLELIEQLVKTRGGSLLMIAGPMAAPKTYANTPIEKILPVKLGSGRWESVGSRVHPVVTTAGRDSPVTALAMSPEATDRIWSHVRPMYALPNLGGAKPGATVLLSLPKVAEEVRDYPLVAWQRYGNGKSLFVATEDLWRMRLEVGDRYHARFWGQTIQFLTLSRLLGQNKQISLETDRRSYSAGEQVRIFANVLTESFEPVLQESYPVILEREGSADNAAELLLSPVPGSAGLYSGVKLASEDGTFIVKTRAQDTEISNRVHFAVATLPIEARETAAQIDVAQQVAEISGGKMLSLSGLRTFPGSLSEEKELTTTSRLEISLWDAPVWFILFVFFTGAEWYFRRRDNLV